MGSLRDRLITWEVATQRLDKLRTIVEREHGRIALYVHTGGGYFSYTGDGIEVPLFGGADKYLANIRVALTGEGGIALLLGAVYERIDDLPTRATVIDLPSVPDFPIPYIGQELKFGDYTPWEPVIEQLKRIGVKDISPFGGETARFDENDRVNGGCVNGALLILKRHFNVTAYPQLCADEQGNHHLLGQPLSTGNYTLMAGS